MAARDYILMILFLKFLNLAQLLTFLPNFPKAYRKLGRQKRSDQICYLPAPAPSQVCKPGKSPTLTKLAKHLLSEVGFEPTPSEEDCDLNAAP